MKLTVDEVIVEWSPEEREQLQDLIEEARERESRIRRNMEASLRGIREIEMMHRGDIGEVVWMIAANWKSIGRC